MPMTQRKFGAEIEMIGLDSHQIVSIIRDAGYECRDGAVGYTTWVVKRDGSFSNGYEITTPILSGEAGVRQLHDVVTALQAAGGTSQRACGLHVHVSIADFVVAQACRIIHRYARYESVIDSFMARSRRGNTNTYCRSMGNISRDFTSNPPSNFTELLDHYGGDRYFKANMCSYERYKTVEIRHHGGTCDPDKIANWVRFCVNFVEQSKLETIEGDNAFYGLDNEVTAYLQGRIQHFAEDVQRDQEREERLVRERAIRRRMRDERNTDAGRELWIGLHNATQEIQTQLTETLSATTFDARNVTRLATRLFYMQPTRGTRDAAQQIRNAIATLVSPRNRDRATSMNALNTAFEQLLAKQLEVINHRPETEAQETSAAQPEATVVPVRIDDGFEADDTPTDPDWQGEGVAA